MTDATQNTAEGNKVPAKGDMTDLLTDQPLSMDEAINKAAQHLPDSCQIMIEIEKGGYDVRLVRPFKGSVSVDGGEGIISDINEAICIANGFVS